MKRLLVGLVLLLLLGALALAGLLLSPLPGGQAEVLSVVRGSHFNDVLFELESSGRLGPAGLARARRLAARLYARSTRLDAHLKVGEYALQPEGNLLDVLGQLERGEVVQRPFTLVDGWNFRQVRMALAKAPALVHELDELDDKAVAAQLGLEDTGIEGWLAPDTYFYALGSSDLELLKRAVARQRAVLDSLWEARAEGLPYQTPRDALIMASIVERETSVPAEMPEIAGVFVNRLRKGMRLQTDPTIIYALGENYRGRIGHRDLKIASPYNTYLHDGLPPGPISMPSSRAIEAALHPAATPNIFFVARGDGTHVFSVDLKAHTAAVRDYQLKRKSDYRSTPVAVPTAAVSGEVK